MNEFKIVISSVPDRENLVAEIWFAEKLIAEINQEKENLKIEMYQTEKFSFGLNDFIEVLESAKKELLKNR